MQLNSSSIHLDSKISVTGILAAVPSKATYAYPSKKTVKRFEKDYILL